MAGTAILNQSGQTTATSGKAEAEPTMGGTRPSTLETDTLAVFADLAEALDADVPQIVTRLTPHRSGGSF